MNTINWVKENEKMIDFTMTQEEWEAQHVEPESDTDDDEEGVNEETQHYILYGEWKIYDEEGNYHCKTGEYEIYKTLEEATESFNKMIEEEKNGDKNDYDLIYLDCMEE